MTVSPYGIILFAHGSRDPLWRGPIEAVAERIRADHPQIPVACAYLELCEPNLPDAVQQMLIHLQSVIHSGENSPFSVSGNDSKPMMIRIIPMFLGMGKHAREDLPELVASLRSAYPQAEFEITATVGEDQRVIALLAQMAVSV